MTSSPLSNSEDNRRMQNTRVFIEGVPQNSRTVPLSSLLKTPTGDGLPFQDVIENRSRLFLPPSRILLLLLSSTFLSEQGKDCTSRGSVDYADARHWTCNGSRLKGEWHA